MKGFRTGIAGVAKGYATKDAELAYTPKGKAVCTLTLGCGDKEKGTSIFPKLEMWGVTAEQASQQISKGDAVEAYGSIIEKRNKKNGRWYADVIIKWATRILVYHGDNAVPVELLIEKSGADKEKKEAVSAGKD